MFVVRPQPDQVIAVYGEDGRMLGTIKFKAAQQGKGRCGLALDFPPWVKFDINHQSLAEPVLRPKTLHLPDIAFNPPAAADN